MSLQVAHKMQILFMHDICLLSIQKALLMRWQESRRLDTTSHNIYF